MVTHIYPLCFCISLFSKWTGEITYLPCVNKPNSKLTLICTETCFHYNLKKTFSRPQPWPVHFSVELRNYLGSPWPNLYLKIPIEIYMREEYVVKVSYFKMSFWCLRIFQKTNKFFSRISALSSKKRSNQKSEWK